MQGTGGSRRQADLRELANHSPRRNDIGKPPLLRAAQRALPMPLPSPQTGSWSIPREARGNMCARRNLKLPAAKSGRQERYLDPSPFGFPAFPGLARSTPTAPLIFFFSFPLLQAWSGFSGQEPLYTSLLSAPNMYVLVPTGRDGRCDLEKAGTKQPTPRFPFAEVPSCLQEPLRPLWKSLRGFTRCFLPRAGRAALSRGSSCRDSGSGYLRLIHPPSVLICYVAVISASTMKMPLCLLPRYL